MTAPLPTATAPPTCIPLAISVISGKGGAGKTSLASHTAGFAALSGWKVLAVDFDVQANLAHDLGYRDHPGNDHGEALGTAMQYGYSLAPPIRNIRPGLDVVPAGTHTGALAALLASGSLAPTRFRDVLAPIAGDYDLIVIDTPPAGGPLLDAALRAAHGVVIPVRHDFASLHGLELMATLYTRIRAEANPDLTLLGVALFGIASRAVRVRAEAREALEGAFAGAIPVFDSVIRTSERAAGDMRRDGMLAFEYEDLVRDANRISVAERIAGRRPPLASLTTASGLAGDYQALVTEVLEQFRALVDGGSDE